MAFGHFPVYSLSHLAKETRIPTLDLGHSLKLNQRDFSALGSNEISKDQSDFVHSVFDDFFQNLQDLPLHTCLQNAAQSIFGSKCIFWVKENESIYSAQLNKIYSLDSSIVSASIKKNHMQHASDPKSHPDFNIEIDHIDSPTICFPLHLEDGSPYGAMQCFRDSKFTKEHKRLAQMFDKKFSKSCHLFLSDSYDLTTDILSGTQSYKELFKKLASTFNSKSFNIAFHDCGKTKTFDYERERFVETEQLPFLSRIKRHFYTDGRLYHRVEFAPRPYFICLERKSLLTPKEEFNLDHLGHLFCASVESDLLFGENDPSKFATRLQALLLVARIISAVLDIDVLIPTIMEKANSLLHTERCSLFLVDNQSKELVSKVQAGLQQELRIPLSKGIVGHTATTGQIVNIPDAYVDSRFDKSTDALTGYVTKSLLSVPIYSNRGEIIGVSEMINKIDGNSFDASDVRMMVAFNVFCGISLDNAKLYNTSLTLSRQLRSFLDMSSALGRFKTVSDVLQDILVSASSVINSRRATIFINSFETWELQPYVSIGEENKHGSKFAEIVFESQKPVLFSSEDIQMLLEEDIPHEKISYSESKHTIRLASEFLRDLDKALEDEPQPDEYVNICCFPLCLQSHNITGVMEFETSHVILPEDLKLLDCFAVFAAVSLEKSELQDIAKYGYTEVKIKKWMTKEERCGYAVPVKLLLDPDVQVFTNNFDVVQFEGIAQFKLLYFIFDHFSLFKEFQITAELFFRFLSAISSKYQAVPYHNWRHAIDVTQFVANEIVRAKFDKILTKEEILAMLVAGICHDADHDGFTNVFNEKAETPLGILYKNSSVMETHHCTQAIQVISKKENNIFQALSTEQEKNVWTMIIHLILSTDMSKHFALVGEMSDVARMRNPDLGNNFDRRFLAMKILLKCGDLSNVARPFELANRWCDVLCEEFFRQGELEKTSGMEYTNPLNDREHLDKPKSQIGFYTFVCLPLFKAADGVFSELRVHTEQIESNLSIWKKEAEENSPPSPQKPPAN